MIWQDAALALAGVIGGGVAIFHGILVQRLMVRPFAAANAGTLPFSRTVQRLVPPLLHFSTVVWLAGGLALVVASLALDDQARLLVGALVGGSYLLGAVFNFRATRGRHPGWMLLAASIALIVLGTFRVGV